MKRSYQPERRHVNREGQNCLLNKEELMILGVKRKETDGLIQRLHRYRDQLHRRNSRLDPPTAPHWVHVLYNIGIFNQHEDIVGVGYLLFL